MLKVTTIHPSKGKDASEDRVSKFKFNMNRFSVSDKVYLFKQTNELICSDLISASIAKDRLQRDYKKLENKLKTDVAEKKAIQNKKTELEKKILQISKGNADDALNKAILEKETEIQSVKKKLKLPHDSHVETAELKIVLEEKQNLETELQNTEAMVGTIQGQKEELEQEIQLLKGQVEKLSLTDPTFSIASELGELIVTNMELINLQEKLEKIKKNILEKDNLLKESLETHKMLTHQITSTKDVLIEVKQVIWDSLFREIG